MVAPEDLLSDLLGATAEADTTVMNIGPMVVPFDTLADIDGWLLDPNSRDAVSSWDDPTLSPDQRVIRALLVGMDYATRRGATDLQSATSVLARESPVAFANADGIAGSCTSTIEHLELIGPDCRARRTRRLGHEMTGDLRSDPSLSFQERHEDFVWGDNPLSSLAVHNEAEGDGVIITGDPSERWGVEVGLPGDVSFDVLPNIEREIGEMPSFIGGVSSAFDGTALVVTGSAGSQPSANAIGTAIHAWTRALFEVSVVDVRIVFAPSRGRSAVLTDMRSRARAFRLYRDAVISGHPDPQSVVSAYQDQTREH